MTHAIIILAAGKGSRLGSFLPKPLVLLAGVPLVRYSLEEAQKSHPQSLIVVVPPGGETWLTTFTLPLNNMTSCIQPHPQGTGHAALCGLEALRASEKMPETVLFMMGDSPLIQASTLIRCQQSVSSSEGNLVTFYHTPPSSYGRVISSIPGYAQKILNDQPDHPETLCFAGVLALPARLALELLPTLSPQGAKNEIYLTDLVEAATLRGLRWKVTLSDASEGLGVNTPEDLVEAHDLIQKRWRGKHLAQGVVMQDPSTIFFSQDTYIEAGAQISPYVILGAGVRIEKGAVIHPFCVLNHVHIKSGSHVGPFAHLRIGCLLDENSVIGSFVEAKNAHIGPYTKAKHMSYLGDITIGAGSTIGAGTVICNYDGRTKQPTHLGQDVFIGAHSTLVAPLNIQDKAFIGAGSVVSRPIPEKALAVSRATLKIFPRRAKSCKSLQPRKDTSAPCAD